MKAMQFDTGDDFPDSAVIYRSLFHNTLSGVAYCKIMYENGKATDFEFLMVNDAFRAQVGRNDIIGKMASEVMPGYQEANPEMLPRLSRISHSGNPERFEIRIEPLRTWFQVSAYSPKTKHLVAIFEVISERKKTEEKLKLAGMVFQDTSEAILIADKNNVIAAVNPAFERITGYSADELTGRNIDTLKSGMQGEDKPHSIERALSATGYWKGELWVRRKDGEIAAADVTIDTHFDQDGAVNMRILLLSDITEKKRSEELIWRQTNYDSLTGLPNRQLFREQFEQRIRQARQDDQPLVLMYVDLDGFKEVNDTFGLQMGDLMLKKVAEKLQSSVRNTDTVARSEGDEFMILLPDLGDVDDIDRIARQILKHISEPIKLNSDYAYLSGSIGITLYPREGSETEVLIRNAIQATHAAKRTGKNRYQFFTSELQEAAEERKRLISDMYIALDSNQFEIVYQPIVELASSSIHKAEALIRWQHPTRGLINPFEFISAAEDIGMILSFGDLVFREAARQAAHWREKYQPIFQVSVNISPSHFMSKGIDLSVWFDLLKKLGLPGQGIVVEITEGLLLDSSQKVIDQLLTLHNAGIQLALDDFGTGYSSIAYLRKFDIDYIKVDKAFVQNLTAESRDMILWKAITPMARAFGIKLIAEGVETEEQRSLLASVGCDYGQGYLFSRPVSKEAFESLLKEAHGSGT